MSGWAAKAAVIHYPDRLAIAQTMKITHDQLIDGLGDARIGGVQWLIKDRPDALRLLNEVPMVGAAGLRLQLLGADHSVLVIAMCEAEQPPDAFEVGEDAFAFGASPDVDPDAMTQYKLVRGGEQN